MPEDAPRRPRLHPSTVLVGGVVILFVITFSITSGLTGFLTAIFFTALFTGAYVVLTGRRSWARLPARRFGVAVLGAALVAMLLIGVTASTPQIHSAGKTSPDGVSITHAPHAPTSSATFSADSPADPATVTTTSLAASVVVSSSSATSATAAALVANLPVKPALSSAGYNRTADFGTRGSMLIVTVATPVTTSSPAI